MPGPDRLGNARQQGALNVGKNDRNAMESAMIVAYVANRFPRWGGGWVLNEVRGLLEAGIDLRVFSFRPPFDDVAAAADMAPWIARTTYVPRGSSWACIAATIACLLRSPLGFMKALGTIRGLGGRMARLSHLGEVFFIASRIRGSGARHVHAQHADYLADAALAAARYLGLPFSFTGHANDLYTNPGRLDEKIRVARFVSTCTAFNERWLVTRCAGIGIPPSRIARVYHGVDLERFTARPAGAAVPAGRLVSIGRLKEKKGFPDLLQALALLKARGVSCTLEIHGDGDRREALAGQIERLGLSREVSLAGTIPHDRIPEVLARSGVFVLPCIVLANQDRDGIPNTILEAMASGVPVVSTAISGIPEVVRDGESGLLVPERNPAALADAIERMTRDAALRERCAREGRRVVASQFSIAASGQALADRFREAGSPQRAT